MVVMLPDGDYTLRRRTHPETEDDHGVPVPGSAGVAVPAGPYPGASAPAGADGSYSFRLDPAAWPVAADDFLDGPGGLALVVTGAPRLVSIPGHGDVDYVAGTAAAVAPPVP